MPLPRISKGDVIKASFLNDVAGGVDELTQKFALKPRQILEASPAEVQNQSQLDGNIVTDLSLYAEVGRSNSEVTVYDQNETNYATIDRIDEITFQNAEGETIVLRFNNPG